jgi:Tfp pilus assembly protein PilZ
MTVVYDTGEGFWSGPVVDASESGLFIETTHDLEIGTKVTLLPQVDDAEDELPFEILGNVVRVNEYDMDNHYDRTPGLAFHFVDMTEEEQTKVRRFLAERGVPIIG